MAPPPRFPAAAAGTCPVPGATGPGEPGLHLAGVAGGTTWPLPVPCSSGAPALPATPWSPGLRREVGENAQDREVAAWSRTHTPITALREAVRGRTSESPVEPRSAAQNTSWGRRPCSHLNSWVVPLGSLD